MDFTNLKTLLVLVAIVVEVVKSKGENEVSDIFDIESDFKDVLKRLETSEGLVHQLFGRVTLLESKEKKPAKAHSYIRIV